MKISSLNNLKAFLQEHGLEAKKYSSQNFLVEENIVQKIVKEACVTVDDLIIEIGPGPGALTEALLATGCQVWAIEKDIKLSLLLRRLCQNEEQLKIFSTDFLLFPLEDHLQKNYLTSGKKAKVVANLPYHITTPILTKLISLHPFLSTLTVMIQKEAAQRCLATTKDKDYGPLALLLQFYSTLQYGFTVEPTCFYPKPSVQSAVMHCNLHPPLQTLDEESLFQIIRTSFQRRRKMLRSSLKSSYPDANIEEALSKQGLNPLSRPEELSLANFINLLAHLGLPS